MLVGHCFGVSDIFSDLFLISSSPNVCFVGRSVVNSVFAVLFIVAVAVIV